MTASNGRHPMHKLLTLMFGDDSPEVARDLMKLPADSDDLTRVSLLMDKMRERDVREARELGISVKELHRLKEEGALSREKRMISGLQKPKLVHPDNGEAWNQPRAFTFYMLDITPAPLSIMYSKFLENKTFHKTHGR